MGGTARGRTAAAAFVALVVALTACGPRFDTDRRQPVAKPTQGKAPGKTAASPNPGSVATPRDGAAADAGVLLSPVVRPDAAGEPACPSKRTAIGTLTADRTVARAAPDPSAAVVARFQRINEQGAPQVFDLVQGKQGSDGRYWARALLPMRPNGTMGWIPQDDLTLAWTEWALGVSREGLNLTVWKACQVKMRFRIALGTGETPTPRGLFYLVSLLRPPDPNGVYGTYAYGLSAYSDQITSWRWGGVVGLHGTNDPSSIGRYVSHGCIRLRNEDIERLVELLPLGTPIAIW